MSTSRCLQLLRPGQGALHRAGLAREPCWTQHIGKQRLQRVDGEDAAIPDPANPELFWHVKKEWRCCSEYIQKWDETLLLFQQDRAQTSDHASEMESPPAELVGIHLVR